MEEILVKLDAALSRLEKMSIVVGLNRPGGESIELLQTLMEAKTSLKRARAALRQVDGLLKKGYGELVEPEVP